MGDSLTKDLINYLSKFVLEERLELLEEKINLRSRHLTLVLEDVFQSGNISAAIRSADCFGIQDVHIIENKNNYIADKSVSLGASKWISVKQYNSEENNTEKCIKKLKEEGYQIIATTPQNSDIILNEIDIENNKIAILLGTEISGLSEKALSLADKKMKINMYGFTESLNISVSAAICTQYLSNKMREMKIDWKIKEEEKDEIMLNWIRNSIKSAKKIEDDFMRRRNEK